MRIRFRGPSGGGLLELADNATVAQLLSALRAETGSPAIAVKFGWPLQTLAADQGDLRVSELGIQRESLTVVPLESAEQQQPPSPASFVAPQPNAAVVDSGVTDVDAQLAADLSYGSGEDVKVEMPESRSNLGIWRIALFKSFPITHERRSSDSLIAYNTSSSCYAR